MGVLCAFSSFGLTFLLRPRFTAQAVFLPPANQYAQRTGPFARFLHPPSTTVYVGLLRSDSALTDVINSAHLQTMLKARDLPEARAALKSMTQVSAETNGFVTVRVTSADPRLAQQITAATLSALHKLQTRLSVDQVAAEKLQYEKQLEAETNALNVAETALKQAQESSGVVLPQRQTLSGLAVIDATRANMRVEQVALARLLQSRTSTAPEVVRLRSEISEQSAQLYGLEYRRDGTPGSGLTPKEAPSINLRFVQLEREVRLHQMLFDVLVREFNTARIQGTSGAPGVRIVDYPELPLHRSSPQRSVYFLTGAVFGFMVSAVIVLVADRYRTLRMGARRSRLLEMLRFSLTHSSLRP